MLIIALFFIAPLIPEWERSAEGEDPDITLWAAGSTVKIMKDDPVVPLPSEGVALKAARNEMEPFQLIVTAGASGLDDVDVTVSDLEDGQGNQVPAGNTDLFRVHYITCSVASDSLGGAGDWPDALIPFEDPYTEGEAVGAPFDVPAGTNQPVWIRIRIPKAVSPGEYQGNISVTVGGSEIGTIPVTLTIWDFELPDRSSVSAIYSVEQGSLLSDDFGVEYGSSEHDLIRDRYYDLLADNRIAPGAIYYENPVYSESGGSVRLDFTESDKLYERMLDDKDATSFGMPLPWNDYEEYYVFGGNPTTTDFTDEEFTRKVKEFFSEVYDHFEEKGWADRHYVYVIDETEWVSDEPFHGGKEGYERVIAWADLLHEANPNLKIVIMDFPMKIVPYWPDLSPYGDIWDPYMDDIDLYPKAIEDRQAAGQEIWATVNDYADFIDYPATAHRSIAWYAYKYDIVGLDLWDVSFWWDIATDTRIDPWTQDPFTYDGNGAGAVLYPGKAHGIDGPITSIRVELARESVEDFEYLRLLEELGGGEFARSAVARLLPFGIFDSIGLNEIGPDSFMRIRQSLAEEILLLRANDTGLGTISGVVKNDDGDPVAGAFVYSDVTGSVTDAEGRYHMAIPAGDHMLTATTPEMGYQTYPSEYIFHEDGTAGITVVKSAGNSDGNITMRKSDADWTVVSSFESDIANWSIEDAVSFEGSGDHVTHGNNSLRIIFDDEKETEMYLEFEVGGGSEFTSFGFDVYNDQEEFTGVTLFIGEGWEYERTFTIAPKSGVRIRIPLTDIEEYVAIGGNVIMGFTGDTIDHRDDGSTMRLGKKTVYLDNIGFSGTGTVEQLEGGGDGGDDDGDDDGFLPAPGGAVVIIVLVCALWMHGTVRKRK